MTVATENLLNQALELPPLERATLVDGLLSSLDRPDPRILELWANEAENRMALFAAGTMRAIPEDEVFSELNES